MAQCYIHFSALYHWHSYTYTDWVNGKRPLVIRGVELVTIHNQFSRAWLNDYQQIACDLQIACIYTRGGRLQWSCVYTPCKCYVTCYVIWISLHNDTLPYIK